MGRKKQHPETSEKRTQILRVAGKMFLSQGYSEVSMDSLADAVPVSKRTLYNHFKDKEALFIAVMELRCQTVFQRFVKALEGKGRRVEETLTHFGKEFLGVVLEPEGINIYRTAITEAQHFPQMGQLFYKSGPKRCAEMLSHYLEGLHEKKVLDVPKPEIAAGIFLGMLTSRLQMRCLLGLKKQVTQKEKNTIIRHAVGIFIKGHQK